MKTYPPPRLEIRIRDYCPTLDEPIWAGYNMDLDTFGYAKDPLMMVIKIIRDLQRRIEAEKDKNFIERYEKHLKKIKEKYFGDKLSLDKLCEKKNT